MTFLELQQELSTVPGARFKSTQSSSYKRWLNARAAELWNLEDWTFRKNAGALSVTAGTDTATAPTDMGIIEGLWDNDGDEILKVPRRDFFATHRANISTGTRGDPETYTVVNKTIYLDPTPGTTSSSWWISYDRDYGRYNSSGTFVPGDMSADLDTPALPDEAHYLLVHGATAMGSINMNDFTYQFAEQGWQSGIDVLRRNYLVDQRGAPQQWGSARVF